MDATTRAELIGLVRGRGLATLGTLHDGWPMVSMVLYATPPDLSGVFIHVSRLALHTGSLLAEPRVGVLIAEPDRPNSNPLAMGRVSIQGIAEPLEPGSAEFEEAREAYVAAHPKAGFNFGLHDFLLVRIRPRSARFVAGFGRIIDLDAGDWARLTA